MNLKSFPGPQPHIRLGGVGVGAARLLGGPYVPVLGDPCHRGSQGWCIGGRVPQLPAPSRPADGTVSASLPDTSCRPCPPPHLRELPPLIISLASASHSTVYGSHCFGLCIIYTVN